MEATSKDFVDCAVAIPARKGTDAMASAAVAKRTLRARVS